MFAGKNTFALPALMLGCRGWCSATPIVAAAATVDLYKAAVERGDLANAVALGKKLYPLLHALVKYGLPRSVHAALEIVGRPAGRLRAPLRPLSDIERDEIRQALSLISNTNYPQE